MIMRKIFRFAVEKSIKLAIEPLKRYKWFALFFLNRKRIEKIAETGIKSIKYLKKNAPTSVPFNNKRKMHSTVVNTAAARIPMIKFIGARLPRPHFDRNALPPLQISGNFAAPSSAPAKATSIGPVGKIPRGQGIEPSMLPQKFKRTGLSEEEIEAINTGFFYQR